MEMLPTADPNARPMSGTNGTLIRSCLVAALGSLLFGFDTAVISGTTEQLRSVFALNANLLGFTVSSALIGTLFGALAIGKPAERWGRRPVLFVLAALFVIASFGCAFAWNWHALVFFRWLGGVAVGGASVVSPMYITEIAPPARRGVLVAISQLNIVLGILIAYLSNYLIVSVLGPDAADAWRWMFGMMAIPSLAFLATVLTLPESPRWLVRRNRHDEAKRVLTRLGHDQPESEVAEIAASMQPSASGKPTRLWQKKHMKPLLLAFMIAAFNQLDGINAILYYTTDIFRMAGASKTSAFSQSVLIGLANLIMTVAAMAVIDRLGRKALLLIGSITFVASHLLAAWVFHTHASGWIVIAALIGIVGSHAYSQGAVVWVYINEILPNSIRAPGSAAACFLMWTLCALVSWSFPVLAAASMVAPFLFFACMMVLQFVLVWFFLPETKGVSLEALQIKLYNSK